MNKPSFLRYGILALLLLFFAQTVGAGPRLSLTADEPVHMAQGYVYWTRGDFRMQRPVAQPPLSDLLPGAFLALQPGPEPETLAGWEEADMSRFTRDFVKWYGPALNSATFASRFPIALIALLGAAFTFRWAREAFGPKGGLLALACWAFDPNLITHSGLATTDILLAVSSLIAVYAAQKWSRCCTTYGWGLLTGIALGAALGSKTSGFFPMGIVGLLFASYALEALWHGHNGHSLKALWKAAFPWGMRLLQVVGIALGVLWALYRFEFRPMPGAQIPLPFTTHWIIWQELSTHLQEGHIAYLMGKIGYTGWTAYYPVTFLLKTPLPFLLLASLALAASLRSLPRSLWQRRALWLVVFLYSLAAVTSTIDIGYRYLLIILPFLYVLLGSLATTLKHKAHIIIALAALIWASAGTLLSFPHYLAFFNELAGGPQGGSRYLVDSNLDWGQGFIALKTWLDEQKIEGPLYLSYYTYTDPALYGLDYTPLPPARHAPDTLAHRFNPDPGLYALSITPRQGVMIADPNTYDWFRHRSALATPGHAIAVYDVPVQDPQPGWVAQCSAPFQPLSTEEIQEGFGIADLRQVSFDCSSSWVYPEGIDRPGWYALSREAVVGVNSFTQSRLDEARLSYEQSEFALYEQQVSSTKPQYSLEGEIEIGALRFLGYTIDGSEPLNPGTKLEVVTYWEVKERCDRPLSIMLHLTSPDGIPVSVGDGLGFPIDSWQVGDVFLQAHRFEVPATAAVGTSYTLNLGAYWLDDLSRWEIEHDGIVEGNQILLEIHSGTE